MQRILSRTQGNLGSKQATFLALVTMVLANLATIDSFAQSTQPNVVLIVVDDLNDYVGFLNGHPQAETPHMNELARRSTVFENAYCTSPVCAPSRTSMLTGKDPSYTGVYSNSGTYVARKTFRDIFTPADGNETIYTLPEILKDSGGYYTANFHKIYHGWSDEGYDNDFDSAGAPCAKEKSWSDFMDLGLQEEELPDTTGFGTFFHGMNGMPMGPLANSQEDSMNDSRMVSRAIEFLQNYATNPADYCDRPFFAAVGIFRPHLPYLAPARFYSDYYERDYTLEPYPIPFNDPPHAWPPNGVVFAGAPEYKGQDYDHLTDFAKELSKGSANTLGEFKRFADNYEPLPQFEAGLDSASRRALLEESQRSLSLLNYLACIRYADHQVGRITNAIHAIPELANNTIIVLLSDNGYSFGEHQHYHKFTLWETDIRIPLIIYDPRNPVDRRVSKRTVGVIDLFPTLLELTGTGKPSFADGSRYEDGISLVPLLEDPQARFNRPVVTTTRGTSHSGQDGNCFPQFSVRGEDWHYIRYQTNGGDDCLPDSSTFIEELYHIGNNREIDPDEWVDLAHDSSYQLMKDYLSQWLPGEALFSQATGSLDIIGGTCSDSITLTYLYQGTDTLAFEWLVNDTTYHTDTLQLQIGETTLVQLKGTADNYFLLDLKQLHPSPIDGSFTLSSNDNIVEVHPAESLPASWTFGDGFEIDGRSPSHRYSRPGTFEITRSAELYGCTIQDTAYVTLTDSAFLETCLPPVSARVAKLSSHKARIEWSSCHNATAYEFSYRAKYLQNLNSWQNLITTDTFINISKVVPDREFAFRIRSLSDSCTSAWSAEQSFVGEKCSPPSIATIDSVVATAVHFRWLKGQFGEIVNQQMGYIPVGGSTPTIQSFPLTTNQASFAGLNPGTTYWLRGRSVCEQYDGNNRYSLLSYPVKFTVPESRLAADQAWQSSGIYDLLGRKLLDSSDLGRHPANAPAAALIPDWLPPGAYLVNGELVIK